jgi:hypothetical protein
LAEASIDNVGLNNRLIEAWRMAARDLGIRVTAPVELRDAAGETFVCEALVEDFGSPEGAVIVSQRTERRVRQNLRSLGGRLWHCVVPDRQQSGYVRKYHIDELQDLGWFGSPGGEPSWYIPSMGDPRHAS